MSMKEICKLKEEVMSHVYNLLLDVKSKDCERQVLLIFKNKVEAGEDFDQAFRCLLTDLRKIAVANIQFEEKMSDSVGAFYHTYANHYSFEENLAKGLCAAPVTFSSIL